MNYAETHQALRAAVDTGAVALTVETDAGAARVSLEDALEGWDNLAPGEAFQILSIHYTEGEGD